MTAPTIAGIVQLDGSPPERTRLERIAPAPYGGDDAPRFWHGAQSGISSTSSAPLVDENSGCVIAFAGRLHNRRDLAAALSMHSALMTNGSDAAYALAAYLQWADDAPARLLGDYAFAVWDPRARRLFVANDALAARPLYFSQTGRRLAFASTLEQLLGDPDQPRRVNEEGLAWFLYGQPTGPRTPGHYVGIDLMPGGHFLVADASGVRLRRYWRLPENPPEPRRRSDEDAEEFRDLLIDSIRCRLHGGPVALTLSGGLDSGSIASVAGVLAESEGSAPIHGYSMVFDRTPQCDERQYSTAISSRYRFPHVLVPTDDCWTLSRLADWLPAFVEPHFGVFEDAWYNLLGRARDDGMKVMMTGDGGDLLFGGSAFYYSDWLLQGRWRDLAHELHSRAVTSGRSYARILAPSLVKLLPRAVQPRVHPDIAGDVKWRPPHLGAGQRTDNGFARYGRYAWWLEQRDFLEILSRGYHNAMRDRLARRFGLEMRQPLNDVRLIEFSLRVPPDVFYREGTTKAVVRQALKDVLPPIVRDRRDKMSIGPLIQKGLPRNREFLNALAHGSELAKRNLILEEPWRRAARETVRKGQLSWALWRTFTAEMWLRHQEGRLALG